MSSWPDARCFGDVWADAVVTAPDSSFLRFESPSGEVREWSYGEFDLLVGRMATALVEAGAIPGHAVHLALTNSPAFVAAWLATIRLGAWVVPSDPMGRTPELAATHRTHTADGGLVRRHRGARNTWRRPATCQRLRFDEADTELAQLDGKPYTRLATTAPHDRAAVMFTSGTTGRPKGVEITQANYAFAGKVMAEAAGLQSASSSTGGAADVPRQRAVLLIRLGDLDRRFGGVDAHLLRHPVPRPGRSNIGRRTPACSPRRSA